MKDIRTLISGLVSCGIALSMLTSASAQSTQQGVAKVVNVKGSARYMTDANSSWQSLKSGATLKPGAIIQTASGSYVDLVLNNPNASSSGIAPMAASAPAADPAEAAFKPQARQDAIRVFENSVLGVDKLALNQTGVETVSDTQLDLKAGSIFFTVKKLTAGSKYEVKIPNGVAGVRGTSAYMSALGILRVFEGQLLVAFNAAGGVTTKLINSGREFNTQTGEETFIGPRILGDYRQWLNELRGDRMQPMTTFARDFTILRVSPTD